MKKKIKCTKEAKRLLLKSIQVWEEEHTALVLQEYIPMHFGSDCPLCKKFGLLSLNIPFCLGCPISVDIGKQGCLGTPYHAYRDNRTVANHLAMITYMKDLYKRCVVK